MKINYQNIKSFILLIFGKIQILSKPHSQFYININQEKTKRKWQFSSNHKGILGNKNSDPINLIWPNLCTKKLEIQFPTWNIFLNYKKKNKMKYLTHKI